MIASAIESPWFCFGLVATGVGYLVFVGEPKTVIRHPWAPVVGWSVFLICLALMISTIGYGYFQFLVLQEAGRRDAERQKQAIGTPLFWRLTDFNKYTFGLRLDEIPEDKRFEIKIKCLPDAISRTFVESFAKVIIDHKWKVSANCLFSNIRPDLIGLWITGMLVRHEQAYSRRNSFMHETVESASIRSFDHAGHNISLAANCADNRSLARTESTGASISLVPMFVGRLAPDIGFVNLDNAHEFAKLAILQAGTDTMAHVPSRAVGTGADDAVNLEGRNAFFRGQHHMNDAEPRLERHIRVFEDGPDRDREPIAIRIAVSALPVKSLVMRSVGYLLMTAARTMDTLGPALARQIGFAGIIVGKQRFKLRNGHLAGDFGLLRAGHDGLPLCVGGYCHA
jgi:hypothetical protein